MPQACVSYLAFFTLVWWIWASQVAYDIRFPKSDWVHWVFVFLQFIVFCALSAFTKDFDIGYKIIVNKDKLAVARTQLQDGFTQEEVSAFQYREEHLPLMNARGISMVMVFSRLVLLSQYLIGQCPTNRPYVTMRVLIMMYTCILAFYQAATLEEWTTTKEIIWRCWKAEKLRSLRTHVCSLIISALFYTAASILLRTSIGSEKSVQIIKIILWYLPLLLEAAMHFLAITQMGHVLYPTERIFGRSAAIFVVILGGGMLQLQQKIII